jgi:hypothetical protein
MKISLLSSSNPAADYHVRSCWIETCSNSFNAPTMTSISQTKINPVELAATLSKRQQGRCDHLRERRWICPDVLMGDQETVDVNKDSYDWVTHGV